VQQGNEINQLWYQGREIVMLTVFDDRGSADEGQEPAVPLRVVAQILTERGLDVRRPEHDKSRRLTVTDARSTRCEIDVYDDDGIRWKYFPSAGGSAEPTEISSVVRRVLDANKSSPAGADARVRRMDTLKGAVAREMNACGLKADLEIYEDHERYEVVAEVVLANPARPERGVVRVADDGVIRWEYDYGETPGDATVIADTTADVLVTLAACEGGPN
jgi:hypothetical protein